jgi:hypothetical protein
MTKPTRARPALTDIEAAGMAWWNGLDEKARASWMKRAGDTGVAAHAWHAFKARAAADDPRADVALLLLGNEWGDAVAAAAFAEQEYLAACDDPARTAELAERDCGKPFDRVEALSRLILEAPAATVRGLALQAAVAGRELLLHYDGDVGEPACRVAQALIKSILSMGGTPAAGAKPARKQAAA